ncbi:MAG: disulfide bond formation protein B [Magnetococcales bacterium]|nr:disulfide bond formation protein B [Magnetococcales bacterium]
MGCSVGVLLRRHGRLLTLLMALGAASLVPVVIVLTRFLSLHPCHLCIFQRVLYLAIALSLLAACWGWQHRLLRSGAFILGEIFSAVGVAIAGQQSWMQWFPEESFGCTAGELGVIEQWVEWLGHQSPTLFLATGGSCENKNLVILTLSLANWSFLVYVVLFASSAALLFAAWDAQRG